MIRFFLPLAIIASTIQAQEVDSSSILSRVDTILNSVNAQKKSAALAAPSPLAEPHDAQSSEFFTLFNAANDAFCRQDFDEAIKLYQEANLINSDYAQLHMNLGVCFIKKSQPGDAIPHLEHAVELNPDYVKAHYHLGKSYKDIGNTQRGYTHLKHATELDHSCIDAQLELGHLLQDEHKFEEALKHLRNAHNLQPNNLQIWFDVANALNMANETEEALEMYFEMDRKHKNVPAILYNIAYTLKKLNRVQEAMPYYETVLQHNPEHSEARFSRSLAYLTAGDFERGWPDYEYRTNRDIKKVDKSTEWDGSPLNGRTVILYGEQGLGDTFQFIRFARFAHESGGHVIAFVQSPVVDIISQCPYIEKVYPLGAPVPPYHVQAPLMSLPYILHITPDTVPTYERYLHADEQLVQTWKEKLSRDPNFKVGICWQGNSEYSTPFLRAVVAAKSMPLNTFAPLAQVPGVSFYSLQKITGENQLNDLGFELKTFDGDFDKSHGRFMDTAAVIRNLDLVISIDTSICHFAAGLGIETWTLLPNPPDWRWMLDREDTPWYPNMRLFRQPEPGDWATVIQQVKVELNKKVHGADNVTSTPSYTQEVLSELFDALIKLSIVRESTGNRTLDRLITEKQEQIRTRTENGKNSHALAELVADLTAKTVEFFTLNNSLHTLTESILCDDELVATARELYACALERKRILEKLDAL
jgi:tetratricopeptide (TPR) repeat protein